MSLRINNIKHLGFSSNYIFNIVATLIDSFYFTCSYRSYKARKQLAAIDWNYHLNQAVATTKAGDMIVSRKYNQRTKEWNSKVVKVRKQYEYIPMLMAKIMKLRKEDTQKVTRNVPLNNSDPALLAPTIADKPAPPSKELFLARKSRFKKGPTVEISESSVLP